MNYCERINAMMAYWQAGAGFKLQNSIPLILPLYIH